MPTEQMPMEFECPVCDGTDCEICDDGFIKIVGCPHDFFGDDMIEVYELVKFYDKGLAPATGGVLDQSAKFVKMASFAWQCESKAKARQERTNKWQ